MTQLQDNSSVQFSCMEGDSQSAEQQQQQAAKTIDYAETEQTRTENQD